MALHTLLENSVMEPSNLSKHREKSHIKVIRGKINIRTEISELEIGKE